MKRPAFQFYPADWRKDVELRSCSMAARGLWIDILCVMHECDPYGHLIINGKPMKAAGLVNHIGGSEAQIKKLLLELIDNGVARLTAEGAIYSKRMVEDEDLRVRRANGGYEGAEHGAKGAEHGRKGGRPRKDQGGKENPPSETEEHEQTGDKKPPSKPPPSSSSSPSGINTSGTSYPHPPAIRLNGSPAAGLPKPECPPDCPHCPHQRIRDLWAELMPELQQPAKWSEARAAALRSRWREEAVEHHWANEEDGLRFFAKLFRWCRKSDFLMGKAPTRPGQTTFAVTVPWLIKAENWAKVQEGNYHHAES